MHGVRAEYERIFAELENRPPSLAWSGGNKLCLPRELQNAGRDDHGSERNLRPLDSLQTVAEAQPLEARQTNSVDSAQDSTSDDDARAAAAEAERLEVQKELDWIRQAMHSRLEYLEQHTGPDTQSDQPKLLQLASPLKLGTS